MQFRKYLLLLLISISSVFSQTLTPGDIAIIGYNGDDTDEFAFVCLVDIAENTQINFTDNGWLSTNIFRTGEGKFTYTFSSFTSAGTVINPTISGILFSTSGDQVLAYQGDDATPTFIYALNNEGAGVWQSDATNSNTSALPTGLVNGTSANALNEIDNAVYNGITSGTKAELLAAISNNANWIGSDATRQTMPIGPFTISGGTEVPTEPEAIEATNITHQSFSANWNVSTGTTAYFLDVSEFEDFTTFLSGFENLNVGNVTTYPVNTLNPNDTYYYRVRASNSIGTSDNSNVITVNTTSIPATTVQFVNASGSVLESGGTKNILVSITNADNTNPTTADLVLITGSATDIDNYTTQTITFPAGSTLNQTVTIDITDDGVTEGNEVLTFALQNVTGGYSAVVGIPSQFNLTIIEGTSGGYYDPISPTATGEQLRFELHNLINDHVEYPYTSTSTDVWDILMETDEDPANPDNVILLYTGRSQAKTFNASTSSDLDAWNREHVWAKSRGDFGTDPPAGTDAHHLRPTDASVNTLRSNKDFDNGGSPVYDGTTLTECFTDADSWEPRNAVKGDVARMIFYMDVRYEGEGTEPELHMVDYTGPATSAPTIGKLTTLLSWHVQDPPDAFEINRNEVIFGYQGNRNPFIDHPEWVDEIWGASAPVSPVIANISRNVKVPNFDQNLIVSADITDNGSVSFAEIRYQVDNLTETNVPMTLTSGNTFSGSIPESDYNNGDLLKYYIYAEDNEGNPKYGSIQQLFTGTTSMAELHAINADGILDYDGILARINGVATVGTPTFSSTSLDFYLQDATGGISIYKAGDAATSITQGNNYTITGNLDQFNGKTELIPEVSSIDIVNNGASTLPVPFEMSVAQLENVAEIMEGRLVTIRNLSLISGTWAPGQSLVLSDNGGTNQITLHYDSSTNLGSSPIWPVDITGIYSQYDDFAPYTNKYQILPRTADDIDNSVSLQLIVNLQGAYSSGEMSTNLNNIYPLQSPYSEDPRIILERPIGNDIVDWVLVELRETFDGPAVASKSALLRKDGRIVSDDGLNTVIKINANPGQYFIVVKHRNHLAVMSADLVNVD
ncbi:MAG: endonuclease [Melioribacteraceae bacterium]